MTQPSTRPFWQTKTLSQMTVPEWESLCDGCGLCCLIRLEDEDTGEIIPTRVHCRLFDSGTCACSNYPDRHKYVPDCIKLTPHNIEALEWMPASCAYRRLHEGKDLPVWHYLICGDREEVHRRGVSVRGQTISETALEDPEDALDFAAFDLLEDMSNKGE
ncbi:YcgN family cysteine cluster protein [Asticcacaulis sp. W401b]|uniref:YcgN family cysteine cluster protein n=1 Tax=Asticcacaulis sp. W401b TaxID=3388666 RepID=UPI0039707189